MKRLVLVTTSFPDLEHQPMGDAAGSFVFNLAEELARYVQTSVLAPSYETKVDQYDGFDAHRFKVPSLPLSLLKASRPRDWMAIIQTIRAGSNALSSLMTKGPIDHVFALWALPSGYWARKLWIKKGVPYSSWALGSDIWSLQSVPIVRYILKTVLRDSRVRFADGVILGDDVERISGKSCKFLSSARRLDFRNPKPLAEEPPYNLAFLGRWHPNKGPDILLKALNLLEPDDWRLIREVRFCGGGPMEGEVVHGLKNLENQGRPVVMKGYLDRQEATDLYDWADFHIIPSRIESIPVVFSDALQGRCVIVSTPVGDLKSLIEDYNVGVAASDATPESLALALIRALRTSPADYREGFVKIKALFDVKQSAERLLREIGLME